MKNSYIKLLSLAGLLLLGLLVGCGPSESKEEANKTLPSPGPGANANPGSVSQSPTRAPDGSSAIDTVFSGEKPDYVVYSRELTVGFQATETGAGLQCARSVSLQQVKESDYEDCSSGQFSFRNMVHGRTYGLVVRAVAKSGLVDTTPLQVAFVVDLLSQLGAGNGNTGDTRQLVDVYDLPQVTTEDSDTTSADPSFDDRSLQIGQYYALQVPRQMYTASYSTALTYNSRLHMLRILDDSGRGAYSDDECDRDYERIIPGPNSSRYCEANPSRSQLLLDYGKPMPYNHVELLQLDSGGNIQSKMLIAAYGADTEDPSFGTLSIQRICESSQRKGATAIDSLNQFYGFDPSRELFSWCQVRDRYGKSWWIGMLQGEHQDSGQPYLQIIYTLKAGPTTISGRHFARQAADLFLQSITPIAPTANER